MKHIKLFEAWSSKFHSVLQGAYAKAKETGLRHGKAAKDIEDYVKRNVSTEKFTIIDEDGNEIVISYDEKFLLEPLTVNDTIYPKAKVIIESMNGKPFPDPELKKMVSDTYLNRPSEITFIISNYQGRILETYMHLDFGSAFRKAKKIRFKNRIELEDFIAMLIQSIISDKSGKEFSQSQIDSWRENKDYMPVSSAAVGLTPSWTKNYLIGRINDVIQQDIRNFL